VSGACIRNSSRDSGQLCSNKLLSLEIGRRSALVPTKRCVGVIAKNNKGNTIPRFMANRKSGYKRMRKIEPAVQTLTFQFSVPAGGSVNDYTLDLSQCASLVNRRFYRQGINWAVSGFKMLTSSQTGTIAIKKLPDTWIMSNSWEKGFRTWQRLNSEAADESESIRPRFLDFKVYADASHHLAGVGANLLPGNLEPTFVPIQPGTWDYSKMIIPKTDGTDGVSQREIIAVGANYPGAAPASLHNAVSLIEGYAASRALPNMADPNMPDDASSVDIVAAQNWMQATFNQGTDQSHEVLEDLILENNIAPYPFENDGAHFDTMYPNGANQLPGLQVHDFEFITGTTVGGTTRMKGGMFPCGLVRVTAQNDDDVSSMSVIMQVDLVPGNHRGYLCEPMTDM